jgi:hypothetical protein
MKAITRAVTFVAALAIVAMPLQAQWSGSVYGTGEMDTNDTNLLLAGLSLSPGGGDIAPIFGIQGYRLSYKIGSGTNTVYAFKPSVGLRFRLSPDASATASVGYAFTDKNVPATALASSADRGDGVVVAGSLDLHPSTSNISWQGMASYNFGSESLWARLRAPIGLRTTENGKLSLAPEVSFINGGGYNAIQPGAVVLWQGNSGFGFGAGVAFNMPNQGDNSTVFKIEASHSLF